MRSEPPGVFGSGSPVCVGVGGKEPGVRVISFDGERAMPFEGEQKDTGSCADEADGAGAVAEDEEATGCACCSSACGASFTSCSRSRSRAARSIASTSTSTAATRASSAASSSAHRSTTSYGVGGYVFGRGGGGSRTTRCTGALPKKSRGATAFESCAGA